MCTATEPAIPVYLCTWAASSNFSFTVRAAPAIGKTPKRVPPSMYAHDGVSICCLFKRSMMAPSSRPLSFNRPASRSYSFSQSRAIKPSFSSRLPVIYRLIRWRVNTQQNICYTGAMGSAETDKQISRTVDWSEEGGSPRVLMIDQTLLPAEYKVVSYTDYREVAQAIKDMVVRGAPAIGAAAALGMALGAYQAEGLSSAEFSAYMEEAGGVLRATRPTAVNLFWAIDRMMAVA